MKKIILVSIVVISLLIVGWSYLDDFTPMIDNATPTQIQFEQTEIDMGQLEQGKPQSVKFIIKNTGHHTLFIQQVEASCGCTETTWPKNPIKPGQSGEVKVTYDAKYPGRFMKSIKVFCNIEKGMVELIIKGEVPYPSDQ